MCAIMDVDFIRDYRDSRKIMLNLEHKLMQQLAPQNLYDSLTMLQKLEVFEYALSNTAGEDLAKVTKKLFWRQVL